MIPYETILKIEGIFWHMQLIRPTVQEYNTTQEYRTNIIIAKGGGYSMQAKEVYCHAEKLNAWHLRIWKKRQAEIPHTAFCEWMEEGKVWRLGFKM